jgi:2-methylcitrate dehydratase
VVITFEDGHTLTDEIAVADAHPLGTRPLARTGYIAKFRALTDDWLAREESGRFLDAAQRLPELPAAEIGALNLVLPPGKLTCAIRDNRGIF